MLLPAETVAVTLQQLLPKVAASLRPPSATAAEAQIRIHHLQDAATRQLVVDVLQGCGYRSVKAEATEVREVVQ